MAYLITNALMDAWNEHGWPTKIPTWHTWILWSSSTNGHEVLCIIQIHDHRGIVECLNMISEDTSQLKTFLLPFWVLSFVWTLVVSFFFFSCSLAGCFSFIYLFIYWWQVSQERAPQLSWFKSNSYCIVFYFIGKTLGQRMKGM
jgi:hypothetical protein